MNLETELLKQNRKIITATELLQVEEYNRVGKLVDNQALKRLGITSSLEAGRRIKSKTKNEEKDTKPFDKERVFHISQIEAVCNKYYLRFLPSSLYSGTIDKDLPLKAEAFEVNHNLKLNGETTYNHWNREQEETGETNSFIMAPMESFQLQEVPKDPLLFYKINDSYYYLIHKWGDDLSWTQRLKVIFSTFWPSIIALVFVMAVIDSAIIYMAIKSFKEFPELFIGFPFAISIFFLIFNIVNKSLDGRGFYYPNNWNSSVYTKDSKGFHWF